MNDAMATVYLAAGYVFVINFIAFFAFASDKRRAKRGARRIPESTLLTLAAVGGSLGAWLAMLLFRHKTLHKRFSLGVPMIFFAETAFLLAYDLLLF